MFKQQQRQDVRPFYQKGSFRINYISQFVIYHIPSTSFLAINWPWIQVEQINPKNWQIFSSLIPTSFLLYNHIMKQFKKIEDIELCTSTHLVKKTITQNTVMVDSDNYDSETVYHTGPNIKRQKISQYIDKLKTSNYIGSSNVISRIGDMSQANNKSQMKWQLNSIEQELHIHKGLEKFMIAFAKNPQLAIGQVVAKGQIQNNPRQIASYLVSFEGLNKVALGEYFGVEKNDSKEILKQYCRLLRFEELEFDKAMRVLLSRFKLPGEAQQIERILLVFSEVYYETHRIQFSNSSQIHVMAYSLIMLNTDAHSSHQQQKMTKQQFIKNTLPCCPGISENYLSGMYDRIVKEKFETETNFIEKIYERLNMLKSNLTGERVAEILKESVQLRKGHIFIKYCRDTVKSVQRRIFLSEDQNTLMWVDPNKQKDTPRSLDLNDLIDITLGINSPVMKKNKVPKQFDGMCFTLQFSSRTLDLKAKDPQHRAKWVNYLLAFLIKRRNEFREQQQQFVRFQLSKINIEQIWNRNIFPHWDEHWDYRHKLPKQQKPIKTFIKNILCCKSWFRKQSVPISQTQKNVLCVYKNPLLATLWKKGLPEGSRKTLWPLVIGNNLKITEELYQIYGEKRKPNYEIRKMPYSHQAIEIVELFQTIRPDIELIRNLLQLAEVFLRYMGPYQSFVCFANMIHSYHFLPFFQGDLSQVQLRLKFFDWLMQINCPIISTHFQAMHLNPKLYFVNWFLSVFSTNFEGELLAKIWDNFLLEGEAYLFKVGITIIKYFQFQLKISTFQQAMKLLTYPKNISEIIFFQLLEKNVKCEKQWYEDYIEKRKQAILKTKVQQIPLE